MVQFTVSFMAPVVAGLFLQLPAAVNAAKKPVAQTPTRSSPGLVHRGAYYKSDVKTCPAPADIRGSGAYLSPAPNQVIPAWGTFQITFCSGRYFKTQTNGLEAYIASSDPNKEWFTVHASRDTPKGSDYYNFLADNPVGGTDFDVSQNYTLVLFETHTNYGSAESVTQTFIPITIVDGGN